MDDIFIKVYNKYYLDVYRLSFSYLLNKQDAEDITQNTFIKLYHHKEILNSNDENIIKWLFRVAINNSKNNLISSWYKKRVPVDDLDIKISNNKDYNNLYLSLIELPQKYRIPIHLYYYYGYSIKEISSIMKIKESTIKSRLLRGKKCLRIEMEDNN